MANATADTSLSATITVLGSSLSLMTSLSDFERGLQRGPSQQRLTLFLVDRDPKLARYCHQHDKFFEKKSSFQAHLEKFHGLCKKRTDFLMILDFFWGYQRPRTNPPAAATAATWAEPAHQAAIAPTTRHDSSVLAVTSTQPSQQMDGWSMPSESRGEDGECLPTSIKSEPFDVDLDFPDWQGELGPGY